MIRFALIRERKTPPDRRVVFSPSKLKETAHKFPDSQFVVESSDIRVFSDDDYRKEGFEVKNDVSECDVYLGVKEVPHAALIPNKKYFFFSHTIKKQPYNRDLLNRILSLNIELYDHEVITAENGARLIGFGRYAGLVGAYNCFRAFGIKEDSFKLPKAETLQDLNDLKQHLDSVSLPAVKILLTGNGKVAHGSQEILDHLKIKQVSVEEFLNEDFVNPVYCMADVLDYNKPKNGVPNADNYHFYNHPEEYESDFMKFAKVSDIFIAGHFYGNGSPVFFTQEETNSSNFKIKLIADISCDIGGPIASTIRPSTIAEPLYGYNPATGTEVDFMDKDAITVMAVDNLPCELPKDASEGFGEMFLEQVIPAFFDGDANGILDRARMTQNGKLTERFKYLQDYVDGKNI